MVCQVCHRIARGLLCEKCISQLRPAPDRILPGGVRLIAAFEHDGPARELVHDLKYRGVTSYADIVALWLRDRLPSLPVVPVPRVLSRRVRYGIDPALEIAGRLGRPVWPVVGPPLHSPRRAGGDHARPGPRFHLRSRFDGDVVVVDDVVTSGATLGAVIEAIGRDRVRLAVAANTSLRQTRARADLPAARASS